MRNHSYAFIIEAAHKTPLESVEGVIVKIWDRKDGIGRNDKPWSLQDGDFRLRDGNVIKLQWNGCPPIDKGWQNLPVRLEANVHGKTGELTGVYAIDDEYNGKTTRKIKLTESHKIVHLEGETIPHNAPPQSAPPAAQQSAPPPRTAPPAANHPPAAAHSAPPATTPPATSFVSAARNAAPPADAMTELDDARKLLAKIAGLQAICYDAAVHNAHGIYERHGIAIMPGAVGVMGDRMFGELIRRIKSPDLLPMDPYRLRPFKGTPLDVLIPAMRQQIGEGKAEIDMQATETRQELGRAAMAAAAATPPPIQPPADDFRTDPAFDDNVPF